jgi:hypothetical protein
MALVWEDINQEYRTTVARRHKERADRRSLQEAARSMIVNAAMAALMLCVILLPFAYPR